MNAPGLKGTVYRWLSLGSRDASEATAARDRRVVRVLATIGVPVAIMFHGGVGALFGVVAARPHWHSGMFPILFLLSELVSGGALLSVIAAAGVRAPRLAAVCRVSALFHQLEGGQPHPLLVEVAGGLWTGSLALLADAGHMLTDVGAIALSLFAVRLAQRLPSPLHTYGFLRMEILAALVNGLVLLVVAGAVLLEAWGRLWAPPEVQGGVMLTVAVGGLAVNLAAMRLLHEGAAESLNLRGASLEVLGDALASLAVIAAAVIIQTTGFRVADPIASGLIGLFMVPRTLGLIRQAVHVLMEGVPAHVDLREVERALAGVPGVQAVHDLHVWTLTSGRDAMSAHAVVTDAARADGVTRALHELVHERFGIDHATIQVESSSARPADQGRPSPRDGNRICGASTCAGPG